MFDSSYYLRQKRVDMITDHHNYNNPNFRETAYDTNSITYTYALH